jgi:NitT/TauT family transport system ATP-binding protein
MARRVSLARALAIAPDLLLLDEPFASLDEASAEGMHALIRRLRRDRPLLGVLLVTHDPAEAAALADRALLLGGRPATILAEHAPGAGGAEALREAFTAAPRDRR